MSYLSDIAVHLRTMFRLLHSDASFKSSVLALCPYLEDEESRQLLRARVGYHKRVSMRLKYRDYDRDYTNYQFHRQITQISDPIYRIEELEQYRGKRLVVFGDGYLYDYTVSVLNHSEWKYLFRGIGNDVQRIKDISTGEVLLIVTRYANQYAIQEQVVGALHFEIHSFAQSYLLGTFNNQYFDVFYARPDEVVIDCGAFDGRTELEILKWGGRNIKKIYAFELDSANAQKCQSFYESNGLSGIVQLINKGAFNQTKNIKINTTNLGKSYSSIAIDCDGESIASVTKVDDAVCDKVTFIKMDIEGAELAALQGARNLISVYKPRLAICIYHKKEDLVEIPQFLLSIVPDYRFYIRHYTSCVWETVLYAYVPGCH